MNTNQYSRTDFLKFLGIGALAMTLPGISFSEDKKHAANVGFQLYTVRKEIERDFDGTIRKLAGMGFLGVETYPLPANVSLEQAAKCFKENGLKVLGMHTELPVGDERYNILKMADAYECANVVYPGWPKGLSASDPNLFHTASEIFSTVDKVKHTVDIYNEINTYLRSRGLKFGIHNHWWEFEKQDGIIPFYYFLEHLDKTIFFEVDTYWAKAAGQDPAKVVKDFGRRAPLLHIKDGPATKDEKMFANVPVGSGTQDVRAITKAGGAHTQWMIVEFDEYSGNIIEGLQQSYTYLTKNALAKGKV